MAQGKTVVVTGGSAGVGRAVAVLFGRQGRRVGVIARGRDGLDGTKRGIERAGGTALPVQADVSDRTARARRRRGLA